MSFRTVDILSHSVRSGDATSNHTFDLARVLTAQGARVRICCTYPPGSALPPDRRDLVQVFHYADYRPAAELTILQYPIWFPLAERFRQAEGVAVFWYHGVTPPSFMGTLDGRDRLVNAQQRTELAWHAHLAVCTSPYTAQELHSLSGYPEERLRVAPLGIDTTSFSHAPDPATAAQLRGRWKLDGQRVLLYVGRIAGNKRIDLLIEALARLAQPDLRLLIVGNLVGDPATTEIHAQLVRQAHDLGVADRVTFTGKVARVEPYLHLAQVVVLPSQHEGFGVPLVEAMAAGAPVIASASGAMPWVLGVDEGEPAGLVFAPGDVGALTEAVTRVLDEPGLADRLTARGRRRADEFSRQRFDERTLAALTDAAELARQGPPPAATQRATLLYEQADVALRAYRVRSKLPVVGRLLEWLRYNLTVHVKEVYVDRVIEQQVNYNRRLAAEIAELRAEIAALKAQRAEERGSRKDAKAQRSGKDILPVEAVKLARIADVGFTDDILILRLSDGRILQLEMGRYAWLSWLLAATPEQRSQWEIMPSGGGVWWPEFDEGVELQPLLDMQSLT